MNRIPGLFLFQACRYRHPFPDFSKCTISVIICWAQAEGSEFSEKRISNESPAEDMLVPPCSRTIPYITRKYWLRISVRSSVPFLPCSASFSVSSVKPDMSANSRDPLYRCFPCLMRFTSAGMNGFNFTVLWLTSSDLQQVLEKCSLPMQMQIGI